MAERSPPKAIALGASLLGLVLTVGAESRELGIRGRVLAPDGGPAAGVDVELAALPAAPELGRRQLRGELRLPAVEHTTTDADGTFRLAAPRPGLWQVSVEPAGFLPAAAYPRLLFEDLRLGDLRLQPAVPLAARLVDDSGAPRAGVLVAARGWSDGWKEAQRHGWWPGSRFAVSAADGSVELPRGPGERLVVDAASGGRFLHEVLAPGEQRSTLVLRDSLRRARLLAADGSPAGGRVAVMRWSSLALGVSDAHGWIELPHRPGEPVPLRFADARGLHEAALQAEPAGDELWTLRLPEVATLDGRVVDGASGQPIAGALIWQRREGGAMAETDAGGSFSLPGAVGPAGLEVAAEGYVETFLQVARAVSDAPLEVRMLPAAELAGRAVDGVGEGLAGARIEAEPAVSSSAPAVTARSDPQGRFQLAGLAAPLGYRIRVTLDGYAERTVLVPAAGRAAVGELTIELTLGLAVRGAVHGGGGEPVIGAEVTLTPASAARAARLPGLPPPRHRAASGPDGSFELRGLGAGVFDLTARAQGHAEVSRRGLDLTPDGGTVDVGTLRMEPGGGLDGRVVDADGEPLAGARVILARDRAGVPAAADPAWQPAATDRAGRFRFTGLPAAGTLHLRAWQAGYLHRWEPLSAAARRAEVVVVLAPALRLAGQVVGAGGEPLPGASVLLEAAQGGRYRRRTDDRGRFELEGLEAGGYTLRAHFEAARSAPLAVSLPADGGADLRLLLRETGALHGWVSDPYGAPVAEATIRLEALDGTRRDGPGSAATQAAALSAADGSFVLLPVGAGPYRLSARHARFHPLVTTVEDPRLGEEVHLVFEEPRSLRLAGRVVDLAGSGVAGAAVQLEATSGVGGGECVSYVDGAFELVVSEPGRYVPVVSRRGYASHRSEPLQLDGEVSGLVLTLSPGGAIEGRLLGLPGEAERAMVSARAAGLGRHQGGVDSGGLYRVPDLAPGEWTVTATLVSAGGVERSVSDRVRLSAAETVRRDLRLAPGFAVTGVAHSGGAPLARSALHVACGNGARARVTTGPEGRFALTGLGGVCVFRLEDLRGGVRARRSIEVRGAAHLEIDVDAAGF